MFEVSEKFVLFMQVTFQEINPVPEDIIIMKDYCVVFDIVEFFVCKVSKIV